MYRNVQLYIDGVWRDNLSGETIPVVKPATEETIGKVAFAQREDLDLAVAAADKGFKIWRKMSPLDRSERHSNNGSRFLNWVIKTAVSKCSTRVSHSIICPCGEHLFITAA